MLKVLYGGELLLERMVPRVHNTTIPLTVLPYYGHC